MLRSRSDGSRRGAIYLTKVEGTAKGNKLDVYSVRRTPRFRHRYIKIFRTCSVNWIKGRAALINRTVTGGHVRAGPRENELAVN